MQAGCTEVSSGCVHLETRQTKGDRREWTTKGQLYGLMSEVEVTAISFGVRLVHEHLVLRTSAGGYRADFVR